MAEFRRCPECTASLKIQNFETHYARQHPHVVVRGTGARKDRVFQRERRRRATTSRREARFFLWAAVAVAVIVVIAVGLPYLLSGPAGRPAADFRLSTSSGASMVLSAYRGRVVLLDFMSTTCPYCQSFTTQALVPLAQKHAGVLVILSIDINREGDDPVSGNARIEAFRASFGATWDYALDTSAVGRLYGVTATPTHFIIDKTGVLRDSHAGMESFGAVEGRIAAYW